MRKCFFLLPSFSRTIIPGKVSSFSLFIALLLGLYSKLTSSCDLLVYTLTLEEEDDIHMLFSIAEAVLISYSAQHEAPDSHELETTTSRKSWTIKIGSGVGGETMEGHQYPSSSSGALF